MRTQKKTPSDFSSSPGEGPAEPAGRVRSCVRFSHRRGSRAKTTLVFSPS